MVAGVPIAGLARVARTAGQRRGVFQDVEPEPGRSNPSPRAALLGFLGLGLLAALVARAGAPAPWGIAATLALVAAGLAAGVGGWRVWRMAGIARRRHYRALRLWGWQLLLFALCPSLRDHPIAGALAAGLLVLLVLATLRGFAPIDRAAALLVLPACLPALAVFARLAAAH